MPRYLFNLIDDMVLTDEEGRDLPSAEEARKEASSSARDIACAEVMEGHLHLSHRIEVADAFGEVLDTVWLRDVVQVHE